MQKYDLSTLGDRLNDLAEVFGKPPVSPKALEVWYETLRDFPTEAVCSILIGWPKLHTRYPAPAEVWKATNERAIVRRETSQQELARELPVSSPETVRKFLDEIRRTIAKPKPTPREHWRRLLREKPPGSIGHRYAAEALSELEHHGSSAPAHSSRVPGEDDE